MEGIDMKTQVLTGPPIYRRRVGVRRVIDWIVARDRAYRDLCFLREAPDHVLQDMGITRHDVEAMSIWTER